jgi:hypothetical protein
VRLLIALALLAGCEKKKHDEPTRPPMEQPAVAPRTPVVAVEQQPAVAPRTAVVAENGLPSECAEYGRAIEALTKCDKIPKQSIDALKQGFDQMAQGWRNIASYPPEARKAMTEGCKSATDMLKQATSARCGVEQALVEADVPPACDEYRRMTDLIMKCDKLPSQARDAVKQGYDQISQTWTRRSVPASERAKIVQGCKQATDALKQAAANACDLELEKSQ